ncbi:MAG: hypothetical protein FJ271_06685 [Planctomycetes bacterium]|nr:hypothetical protein [Planctomycetota bacterium]
MKHWQARLDCLALAALFVLSALCDNAASGFQELGAEAPAVPIEAVKRERDPLEFWFDPVRARAGATAQLILAQQPVTATALRIAGKALQVWGETEFGSERAPDLDARRLASISERDGKPMPNLEKRAPDLVTKAERDYIAIYNQAFVNSFQTPIGAFIKSARENEHVNFARMYQQTGKLRGKVIPIKGFLRRLREFDASPSLQAKGIKYIYEGWIALPTDGAHPICVVFPILPEKLKPTENMNRWVEFYGYLINRYKYRSGRGDLETPFLIGPTVIPAPQPPPDEQASVVTPTMLYGFVGFIVAVALTVVALNLWFRRGDRQVRDHLAQRQAERALEAFSGPQPFEPDKPHEHGT